MRSTHPLNTPEVLGAVDAAAQAFSATSLPVWRINTAVGSGITATLDVPPGTSEAKCLAMIEALNNHLREVGARVADSRLHTALTVAIVPLEGSADTTPTQSEAADDAQPIIAPSFHN